MNKLKKWLIGALTAATLAGAVAIATKKSPAKEVQITKEISYNKAQEYLDTAFERAKPLHLERIIYDPHFKEQDNFLRKQLQPYSKEFDTEKYVLEARKDKNSHNMCVTGVMLYVGDGKKRPAFARKELFESESVYNLEDLTNLARHEDVHAEEECKGYDFGTERKKGLELTILFNTNQIRLEVINGVGEIGAYAVQIEAVESGLDKVSKPCFENARTQLRTVTRIINKSLANNSLLPFERQYTETKMRKYERVIRKLK